MTGETPEVLSKSEKEIRGSSEDAGYQELNHRRANSGPSEDPDMVIMSGGERRIQADMGLNPNSAPYKLCVLEQGAGPL